MPSIGKPNQSASFVAPVARLEISGWLTREKMKFAFLSSASDIYENAMEVSSKEILGSVSIVKRGASQQFVRFGRAKITHINSNFQAPNLKLIDSVVSYLARPWNLIFVIWHLNWVI